MAARISVITGHIERLTVDAVVNAANVELHPGTGVDGALRAAAGPALTEATRKLAPIREGDAVITPGFNAPAKHIIHTAAPVWFLEGEESAKIETLARCYANAIALAGAHGLSSIAFPCLGTGNFGWPRDLARDIAIESSREALTQATSVQELVFCCFNEADAELYRSALR